MITLLILAVVGLVTIVVVAMKNPTPDTTGNTYWDDPDWDLEDDLDADDADETPYKPLAP